MTALLALNALAAPDRTRVIGAFRTQNPGPELTFKAGDLEVLVTGNGEMPVAIELESGAFAVAAGVLLYKQSVGTGALERLLHDQISHQIDEGALGGAFAVLTWDGVQARFFTDWLGNMCAYHNDAFSVWSTSFLATVASYARHQLDRQGAWEYIFLGAPCGTATVLERIRRVDPEKWHDPMSANAQPRQNQLPREAFDDAPFSDLVDRTVDALNEVFDCIANHYGDRIDTALSGGYDSRLIVAALRCRGVRPRIHVYGKPTDSDVQIAKSIAAAEGFELHHIDKSTLAPSVDRESVADAIARNFIAFDGLSLDGIFDRGADLQTRQDRMQGGYLALNGGGGEVFRNFFYFPDRRIALRDLMATFYSRFDPSVCTELFDAREFTQNLMKKVVDAVRVEASEFKRNDIERVYPLFRCRYWMAYTTSINNQIGRAMTPLVHIPAVARALRVPIRHKNSGRLEAAIIEAFSPNMAKHRSNYRRSLIARPTAIERLREHATLSRPMIARRISYGLKQYLSSDTGRFAWMQQYNPYLPDSWEAVGELVVPDKMRDIEHLRRTATLQIFCNQVGAAKHT